MRHRKKFNHLGRKAGHRRALLANMASSLILHKRIKTTTAKAKALRVYVEPLITKTKGLSTVEEKTHAQRVVFGHLQNKYAVQELFGDVASKVETRPGGYTRILKLGNRPGDNADMCFIELVDYNENMLTTKEAKKTTRRSRRGGKKKSDTTAAQVTETTSQPAESEDTTQTAPQEEQSQISDAEVVDAPDQQEASTETETQAPETETSPEEQSSESESADEGKTQAPEEETDSKKQDSTGKSEEDDDNKEDNKSKG